MTDTPIQTTLFALTPGIIVQEIDHSDWCQPGTYTVSLFGAWYPAPPKPTEPDYLRITREIVTHG